MKMSSCVQSQLPVMSAHSYALRIRDTRYAREQRAASTTSAFSLRLEQQARIAYGIRNTDTETQRVRTVQSTEYREPDSRGQIYPLEIWMRVREERREERREEMEDGR